MPSRAPHKIYGAGFPESAGLRDSESQLWTSGSACNLRLTPGEHNWESGFHCQLLPQAMKRAILASREIYVLNADELFCRDNYLIPLNEKPLRRILKSWVTHCTRGRSHASLGPGVPEPGVGILTKRCCGHRSTPGHRVASHPDLGGCHRECRLRRVAA